MPYNRGRGEIALQLVQFICNVESGLKTRQVNLVNSEKDRIEILVEDDDSQRMRVVIADSEEEAENESSRILESWSDDGWSDVGYEDNKEIQKRLRRFFSDEEYKEYEDEWEDIVLWYRLVLDETVDFPELPSPPECEIYRSVFLPEQFSTMPYLFNDYSILGHVRQIHVDDYSYFFSTIHNADMYRLSEKIQESIDYPVPKPLIEKFPNSIIEYRPKELPSVPLELVNPQRKWFEFWKKDYKIDIEEEAAKEFLKDLLNSKIQNYNDWLIELLHDRKTYWRYRKDEYKKACIKTLSQWKKNKSDWEQCKNNDKEKFDELCANYETGDSKFIIDYFVAQLDSVPLPYWCSREYELHFDSNERLLLIEVALPNIKELTIYKTNEIDLNKILLQVDESEKDLFIKRFYYLITLRLIWEIPQIDYASLVNMVCCNGCMIHENPATGRTRKSVIQSVVASSKELRNILLDRIEPEACFRGLKGISSTEFRKLIPVYPLITFNKNENKFIKNIGYWSAQSVENLPMISWHDFEHLINVLINKVFNFNTKVRSIISSTNQEIEAVAFDPDPFRGGEFLIQAKKTNNIIDISEVNKFYEKIIQKGVSKGIFITTNYFESNVYDFTVNKQITLINVTDLISILNKYQCPTITDVDDE